MMKPTDEQIRGRAYQIFLSGAFLENSAEENWLLAEQQLTGYISSQAKPADGRLHSPPPHAEVYSTEPEHAMAAVLR